MQKAYNNLNEFLINHRIKDDKSLQITHTAIGNTDLNIYSGAYHISGEDWNIFMDLYYQNVFIKNNKQYLTEKQSEVGPILVDFDFRYKWCVSERQHTEEIIENIILVYTEELKNFFEFKEDSVFDIFISEKPNINRVNMNDVDKNYVKDGIHMCIGIQMDHVMQQMLRSRVMLKLMDVFKEMPLTNDIDSILDLGISKGCTNWQLFGSRKPGNEVYELSYYIENKYDDADGEFITNAKNPKLSKDIFIKMSAQYIGNLKLEINEKILNEYNELLNKRNTKTKKGSLVKSKIKFQVDNLEEDEYNDEITLDEIKSEEILEKAIQNIFKNLNPSDYYIKEIHNYTQILPEKYYEAGSHLLNRQVAFALKTTDERLFLSWIKLRSKAVDFDYDSIPILYNDWKKYFNKSQMGITKKSIIYWARTDAFEEYEKVRKTTVDYYFEMTVKTSTEYDFAQLLYQIYGDKYVCSNIKNNEWYIFKSHRWELDRGNSLRMSISKDMYNLYMDKIMAAMKEESELSITPENEKKIECLNKRITKLVDLSNKLKKTHDKNNIMREASEIFYDKNFITNIDANKYLLGFTNGVIDFKAKEFRDGNPQDYITKSTRNAYIDYKIEEYSVIKNEIIKFMEQLFPIPELNEYMWAHLSSTLIGVNLNQTFNIYKGRGSNGKSKMVDLMSRSLGDYKGTVPLALITEKKGLIGGTSSEIMQLKGVRYAVMQEPSKDMKVHEGTMKELTGGDPLQGRSLYCESETFDPQFTLGCCTNVDLVFTSNDEGTWRRVRDILFPSKFVDEGYVPEEDEIYIYPKDMGLDDKIVNWAPVFISMLVQKAFETDGVVKDCNVVLESSRKYRQRQDNISSFVNQMVIRCEDETKKLRKRELSEAFKQWMSENSSNLKCSKVNELYEYMNKKFKVSTDEKGWKGCYISYEEDMEELNMVQ